MSLSAEEEIPAKKRRPGRPTKYRIVASSQDSDLKAGTATISAQDPLLPARDQEVPQKSTQDAEPHGTPNSTLAQDRRRKYKTYTTQEKISILEDAQHQGLRATSRLHKIPVSTLGTWKKQDFSHQRTKAGRLPGAGRKISYGDGIDTAILQWILEQREDGVRVTSENIMAYARETVQPIFPKFQASRGWLGTFMRRHDLSLHGNTSPKGQEKAPLLPPVKTFGDGRPKKNQNVQTKKEPETVHTSRQDPLPDADPETVHTSLQDPLTVADPEATQASVQDLLTVAQRDTAGKKPLPPQAKKRRVGRPKKRWNVLAKQELQNSIKHPLIAEESETGTTAILTHPKKRRVGRPKKQQNVLAKRELETAQTSIQHHTSVQQPMIAGHSDTGATASLTPPPKKRPVGRPKKQRDVLASQVPGTSMKDPMLATCDFDTIYKSSPYPNSGVNAGPGLSEQKRGRYKTYTTREKISVLVDVELYGLRAASRLHKIPVSTLGAWMKQDLFRQRTKSGRLPGSGRKISYGDDIDTAILQWILEKQKNQVRVTSANIMAYARDTVQPKFPKFQASRGWLEAFMRRHGLSLPPDISLANLPRGQEIAPSLRPVTKLGDGRPKNQNMETIQDPETTQASVQDPPPEADPETSQVSIQDSLPSAEPETVQTSLHDSLLEADPEIVQTSLQDPLPETDPEVVQTSLQDPLPKGDPETGATAPLPLPHVPATKRPVGRPKKQCNMLPVVNQEPQTFIQGFHPAGDPERCASLQPAAEKRRVGRPKKQLNVLANQELETAQISILDPLPTEGSCDTEIFQKFNPTPPPKKRPVGRPKKQHSVLSSQVRGTAHSSRKDPLLAACASETTQMSSPDPDSEVNTVRSLSEDRRGKYKTYATHEKISILVDVELYGLRAASRIHKIPVSTLSTWKKQDLYRQRTKSGRLPGAGRKILYGDEIDTAILQWIVEQQDKQVPLTTNSIMTYARDTVRQNFPEFKASRGWLQGFMSRHGLSLGADTCIVDMRTLKRNFPRCKATGRFCALKRV